MIKWIKRRFFCKILMWVQNGNICVLTSELSEEDIRTIRHWCNQKLEASDAVEELLNSINGNG